MARRSRKKDTPTMDAESFFEYLVEIANRNQASGILAADVLLEDDIVFGAWTMRVDGKEGVSFGVLKGDKEMSEYLESGFPGGQKVSCVWIPAPEEHPA